MSSSTQERAADEVAAPAGEASSARKERSRRRAVRHAGPPVGETGTPQPVVLAKSSDAHSGKSAEPKHEPVAVTISTKKAAAEGAVKSGGAPPPPGGDTKMRRSWKSLVGYGVAAVVILALVVAAVVLLLDQRSARERDDRRQAFIDTARQTVLNLTTIHPETAKEDVDRILAGASGAFLAEFQGREDPFVGVVRDANVTTEGEVLEAGIQSETEISADVLVAARTMVTSTEQPEPSPRDFRMRVTVSDDNGKLTASKVEFVP
ncbi:hypothetical protein [Rhodococcus tibetensis]|uniref:Mce-associated membrane protein n=1 Tax=Rhodococcus tibetensis TaxID=2965064 RepID=A0ABT1Q7T8_9NOCA|nr:hypothetical protein [Rhodococcus sp. FXJ9.536]MCQ4117795.1 hypothetical protein [Rhodococcus sp. FXJ9.536]